MAARLTYVTPKKCETYELENIGEHREALRQIAVRIENFLALSDDPEFFKSITVPDLESSAKIHPDYHVEALFATARHKAHKAICGGRGSAKSWWLPSGGAHGLDIDHQRGRLYAACDDGALVEHAHAKTIFERYGSRIAQLDQRTATAGPMSALGGSGRAP